MSESLLSNPLKFETNPYHNVVMKDRKSLDLTGVKQIDSFDSNEFLLETSQGWMLVQGKDLTLGKLDTRRGQHPRPDRPPGIYRKQKRTGQGILFR